MALRIFFCFILLLVSMIYSHAQQADSTGRLVLENIDTWKIRSATIGDDFTLYVLKTDDYDTSKKQYDVLYMTDGDWNMTVAMNCFRMLRQDYKTHEPLVVGIGYGKNENKRGRDLNPETGGPAFLTFIEKEVMPFIDKTYRTTPERAIYGYSLGGMFTTYLLFNRADLFQKIFIGAPGNNGMLLMPAARKYFADHSDLRSKVFIGVGSYETQVVQNIDSFTAFMRSKKLPGLELRSDISPNLDHGSGLAQVMQNALAFGYCDRYTPVAVDKKLYKQYAGHYIMYEADKIQAEIDFYYKDGKFSRKWDNEYSVEEELFAINSTDFYSPTNETSVYRFGDKDMTLLTDGKQYRLVKK